MKIKVTGFPGITNKEEILQLFSKYGDVLDVEKAHGTNIAYVNMAYEHQGHTAIYSLDGTRLLGRIIKVEECT